MIKWYNTLISVVLALAIGFAACLVLIPREIVVEPTFNLQVGPEVLWSEASDDEMPTKEKVDAGSFVDELWRMVEILLGR